MNDIENNSEVSELTKYLKASLLLQIRNLAEDESKNEKIEFVLYRSGFSRNEIAVLLNKKYETVKKTLQTLKIINGNLKLRKDGENERKR